MSTEELLAAAMVLPERERLLLATRLLESVPETEEGLCDDDPELYAELERRFADMTGSVAAEDLWKSS